MPLKGNTTFIIRKYDIKDRPSVRRICCETALMGEPSSAFFNNDDVFADALTSYFTDYESESCFVAEYDNNVIGYLIGAKSNNRMNKIFFHRIISPLFIKALFYGVFFNWKNIRFLSRIILSLIKGEFNIPDFSKDYPATLHVNIVKKYRAMGVGSELISAYINYLNTENVKGVHLATMSEKGGQFFAKAGFQLLFQGKRSYFWHILNKNVPVYIYGRQLLTL